MHTCPDCGHACFCNYDIEDHDIGDGPSDCTHCDGDLFDNDDDLGAPDDDSSARAASAIASCIGCGCDDRHACDGGCWWLEVDYAAGLGVCNRCVEHLDAWHDGDRTPHAPSVREEEAEAVRDLGRELRFEQPRPPGWRPDTCQHDWPYPQPDWGDACRWCGMSFARHVHTQCP